MDWLVKMGDAVTTLEPTDWEGDAAAAPSCFRPLEHRRTSGRASAPAFWR